MQGVLKSAYGIIDIVPVMTGNIPDRTSLSGIVSSTLDLYKSSFQGPYSVVSKIEEDQILETANKNLTRDIFVARIPITKLENEQGGYTITIGGVNESE